MNCAIENSVTSANVTKEQVSLDPVEIINKIDDFKDKVSSVRTELEKMSWHEELEKYEQQYGSLLRGLQEENLKIFNRVLFRYGIRRWAFNKSFIVSEPPVHRELEKRYGIYVPMWEAAKTAGVEYGCGNSNQVQAKVDPLKIFGNGVHRVFICIADETGKYTTKEIKDTEETDVNIRTWIFRY